MAIYTTEQAMAMQNKEKPTEKHIYTTEELNELKNRGQSVIGNIGNIAKEAGKTAMFPIEPAVELYRRGPEQSKYGLAPIGIEGKVGEISRNPAARQFASNYLNQQLGGVVKPIMNATGGGFPTPQTKSEKIAGTVGSIAGFTAGLPTKVAGMAVRPLAKKGSHIFSPFAEKLLGKGTSDLAGTSARIGAQSAIAGALTTDADTLGEFADISGRKNRAIYYGATGAVLPVVGKGLKVVVAGPARYIAHKSGISDWAIGTIKRLGTKKVFDVAKADENYISNTIVPKTQERLASLIQDNSPLAPNILEKLGVQNAQIELLPRLSASGRKLLANVIRGKEKNAPKIVQDAVTDASAFYRKTLDNIPDELIDVNIKNTYWALRQELYKNGWIDKLGKPLERTVINNRFQDNITKVFSEIERTFRMQKTVPITKQKYFQLRNDLEAIKTGNDVFDRIVYRTESMLKNDFERGLDASRELIKKTVPNSQAVIASLKEANKRYAEAKSLEGMEKTISKLGDEKVPFNVFLESKLRSIAGKGASENKANLRNMWEKIIGKDNYENIEAHLANKEFVLKDSTSIRRDSAVWGTKSYMRLRESGTLKKVGDVFRVAVPNEVNPILMTVYGFDKDGEPLVRQMK